MAHDSLITLIFLQDLSDRVDAVNCEPTDTVIAGDILLPTMPSTGRSVQCAFFRFQMSQDKPVTQRASTLSSQCHIAKPAQRLSVDMLRQPLPLPPALCNRGLTRSQLLFSIATSIDPQVLQITGNTEFFLFMDMHIEFQWTSFGMMAAKWARATKTYNDRLFALEKKESNPVVAKNP